MVRAIRKDSLTWKHRHLSGAKRFGAEAACRAFVVTGETA